MPATARRSVLVLCAALVLTVLPAARGESGERLARVRALYAQAAYAEALAATEGVPGAEAARYRALCLLALGRVADAEQALEALVREAPAHYLPESEVPPRLLQLFIEVRRRVLPDAMREILAGGRTRLHQGAFEEAREAFRTVLSLTMDADLGGWPLTADLRVLALGYLDLVGHVESKRLPVEASPAAGIPPGPAPRLEIPRPPPRQAPNVVVPAVSLYREIPTFVAAAGDGVPRVTGVVRVTIDADGSVIGAAIERSVDPRYDARLLGAARSWSYRPAMRNGRAIPWEQVVEVRLGPD